MRKWTKHLEGNKKLFQLNEKMITDNNRKMLNVALLVCAGTYGLLVLMTFFVEEYVQFRMLYSCTLLFALLFLILHQFIKSSKLILAEIYICFTIFFLYACYASFISAPAYISVVALVCQITLPAIIVDYTWRVSFATIAFDVFYCIGASIFKINDLMSDEIINITAFTIVGIFIGYYMRKFRLENYEHHRLTVLNEQRDFLTTLYNRKKLFMDLHEDLSSTAIGAFFMMDVDHFKNYNDSFGHPEGDACLRKLGARMILYAQSNAMRVYRFGGEEFACLVYTDDHEEIERLAEGLRQAIYDLHIPHKFNDNEYVSISIGVCQLQKDESMDDVIKHADDALYEAKQRGRNQIAMYPMKEDKDALDNEQ